MKEFSLFRKLVGNEETAKLTSTSGTSEVAEAARLTTSVGVSEIDGSGHVISREGWITDVRVGI